jgi:hypothetical protein
MACSAKLPPVPNSNPCAILFVWRLDLISSSKQCANLDFYKKVVLNQLIGVLFQTSCARCWHLNFAEVQNFQAVIWLCYAKLTGQGSDSRGIFFLYT